MKKIKQFDLALQITALVGGITVGLILQDYTVFITYFVVGGLQVASFLLHFFANQQQLLIPQRRRYGNTLLVLLIVHLICLPFNGIVLVPLFALLFISPFLAVWYGNICYQEIKLVNNENNG